MKYALFLIIGCLSLAVVGCSDPQAEVKALNDEVLELHDSAMVKMDAIYAKVASLREIEQELAMDSAQPNEALRESALDAIARLHKADDAMMDWMRDYEPPGKDAPVPATLSYLEGQKGSIIAVDQAIDESLEHAQEVLDNAKK